MIDTGTLLLNRSNVNDSGGYIEGKVEWQSKYDASKGTVKITADVYCRKGNENKQLTVPTVGVWVYQLRVTDRYGMDHDWNSQSTSATSILTDWVKVGQGIFEVAANNNQSDEVLTFELFGVVMAQDDSSYAGLETLGFDTYTLYDKPRVSALAIADPTEIGSPCRLGWYPTRAEFGYKLRFFVGNFDYTTNAIAPGTTDLYVYNQYIIPYDILYAIAETSADTPRQATIGIQLYSYADRECKSLIGSTIGELNLTIPENEVTRPMVSSDIRPLNQGLPSDFDNNYIQGISRVKATVQGEGKYGANIRSGFVRIPGSTVYVTDMGQTVQTPLLNSYGSVDVITGVTDMRYVRNESAEKIYVDPYQKPRLLPPLGESTVVCKRCDKDGTLNPQGESILVKGRIRYSPIWIASTGKNANYCTVGYTVGDVSKTLTTLSDPENGYDLLPFEAVLSDIVFERGSTYRVDLTVTDYVGKSTHISLSVSTAATDFHLGGNKAAFGKRATRQKAVDIADDWDLYWRDKPMRDMVCEVYGETGAVIRKWATENRIEIYFGYEDKLTTTESIGGMYVANYTRKLPVTLQSALVLGTADNACYVSDASVSHDTLTAKIISPQALSGKTVQGAFYIMGTY